MKKLIILFIFVVLFGTSCKTSGYGCRGKESWSGVVKRINRPY
jgi:hypothetical protein